ncbi:YpmS family protein [Neobacillus sp. SM06]|uniref:YpmS family protein n=1 Tax=Neobacillus sp. SM06 TaxID=3422492 RepID=UPI003D2C1E24
MKNKWKKGFFLILGIDLLIVLILLFLVIAPGTNNRENQLSKKPNGENVSFYIQSNKEDLNKLINYYLKKQAANTPIDYQIKLADEVELYGTLPFFSEQLNMKLTFEPEALKNGDLILKQKSISIGNLQLPAAYVLQFISENYKLPQGVEIRPNDKLIYMNMDQFKLKSNAKVKVNKFDLKKNDIAFTLLVPVK